MFTVREGRQIIEGREEEAETRLIGAGYWYRAFGIVNANLAVDYTSSDSAGILAALVEAFTRLPSVALATACQTEDCTWHMWRNALMEARESHLVPRQMRSCSRELPGLHRQPS